jgi:prephenate dehydrogenase
MLLSAAFVSTTMESPLWSEMARLASGGYRDLSRLASGNPEMNRDICLTNREEILYWIDCYVEELKRYRYLIEEDGEGLRNALARAREAREKWLQEEGR